MFTATGTCIDLILTNNPKSFQNTGVIETGVSDNHLLIFSFLKTSFTKMPPNKHVIISTNRLIK